MTGCLSDLYSIATRLIIYTTALKTTFANLKKKKSFIFFVTVFMHFNGPNEMDAFFI